MVCDVSHLSIDEQDQPCSTKLVHPDPRAAGLRNGPHTRPFEAAFGREVIRVLGNEREDLYQLCSVPHFL
jgi:hypothetical protein